LSGAHARHGAGPGPDTARRGPAARRERGAALAARTAAILSRLSRGRPAGPGPDRLVGGDAMSALAEAVLRTAGWLLLAPLLPGVINRVKAWVAGRRGPPVLQLYYDLARVWKKSVVLSNVASPGLIWGPAVAWVAMAGATLLVPLGPAGSSL